MARRKPFYVVVMQGVNIQGVHGVYSLDEARLAAQQFAASDVDGYHTWDVHTLVGTGDGLSEETFGSYRKDGRHIHEEAWNVLWSMRPIPDPLDVTSAEWREKFGNPVYHPPFVATGE